MGLGSGVKGLRENPSGNPAIGLGRKRIPGPIRCRNDHGPHFHLTDEAALHRREYVAPLTVVLHQKCDCVSAGPERNDMRIVVGMLGVPSCRTETDVFSVYP